VRPGRAADHSPSSNAAVMEEGHTGPVTRSLYFFFYWNRNNHGKNIGIFWINFLAFNAVSLSCYA